MESIETGFQWKRCCCHVISVYCGRLFLFWCWICRFFLPHPSDTISPITPARPHVWPAALKMHWPITDRFMIKNVTRELVIMVLMDGSWREQVCRSSWKVAADPHRKSSLYQYEPSLAALVSESLELIEDDYYYLCTEHSFWTLWTAKVSTYSQYTVYGVLGIVYRHVYEHMRFHHNIFTTSSHHIIFWSTHSMCMTYLNSLSTNGEHD